MRRGLTRSLGQSPPHGISVEMHSISAPCICKENNPQLLLRILQFLKLVLVQMSPRTPRFQRHYVRPQVILQILYLLVPGRVETRRFHA